MPIYRKDYNDEDDEIVVPQNQSKPKDEGKPAHESEDLSWKDRYGNLRSYTQKQLNEKDKEVAELKRKLQQAENSVNLPKTKEQVEEWAKKYPEPYAFVKSIIGMDLNSVTQEVSTRFQELQEREAQAQKREAELKLAELHPDFYTEIRDSKEFADWLSTKSKRMQDALYEDDDPIAAAEVITLYKVETGFGKPKRGRPSKNEAAFDIPNKSYVTPNNGAMEYEFTESQINAMSQREYEEKEEEILKAQREGRILMDISGAAR